VVISADTVSILKLELTKVLEGFLKYFIEINICKDDAVEAVTAVPRDNSAIVELVVGLKQELIIIPDGSSTVQVSVVFSK
jgi:hypothetical protein